MRPVGGWQTSAVKETKTYKSVFKMKNGRTGVRGQSPYSSAHG